VACDSRFEISFRKSSLPPSFRARALFLPNGSFSVLEKAFSVSEKERGRAPGVRSIIGAIYSYVITVNYFT